MFYGSFVLLDVASHCVGLAAELEHDVSTLTDPARDFEPAYHDPHDMPA